MSDDSVDVMENTGADQTEALAREQGWVPEDEYTGKHPWKSAEEFLQFGERLNPILKKQRDEFRKELQDTRNELASYRAAVETITKENVDRLKQEHEQQLKYLKQQLREARRAGEFEVADQLEDTLDELKANAPTLTPPKPGTPPAPVVNPEYVAWRERNEDWVDKNKKLSTFALGRASQLREEGYTGKAFFEKLDEEMAETFPEYFNEERGEDRTTTRRKPMTTGGDRPGTNRAGARPGSGVASLPAEAKAVGQRHIKEGLFQNMEEYAKIYWASK